MGGGGVAEGEGGAAGGVHVGRGRDGDDGHGAVRVEEAAGGVHAGGELHHRLRGGEGAGGEEGEREGLGFRK